MRTRPGTRKASRVPPHAYCRALLIGPDPGGMKYKNRNKAPLPVPGEMLRYRIRDSAGAPSRPRKQTQRNPAAAAPVLSALAACVLFFFCPLLYRMSSPERLGGRAACRPPLPRARTGATASCPRFSHSAGNSAIIDGNEGRRLRLLYPAVCSFETNRRVFVLSNMRRANGTIPLEFSLPT